MAIKSKGSSMKEGEFEEIAQKIQQLIDLYQKKIKWTQIKGISDLDITLPQYFALMTIFTVKQCSMKDLAVSLRVSYPTVTGVIDRLERHGYVTRLRNNLDRRVVNVKLSDKGLKMAKKINMRRFEYLKEALKSLTDDELRQGIKAFTIFSKALLNGVGK
jgi:MarR family transcriptional regulator, organic hydroperoxide resistance regulator